MSSRKEKAEARRNADYDAARGHRDDKRGDAGERFTDALNAYQKELTKIENEYFHDLDTADLRFEKAIKGARHE